MTPERGQEIRRLFEATIEQPPDEREAFLVAACKDVALRAEVEKLLAADVQAGDFIEEPPFAAKDLTDLGRPGRTIGPYEVQRQIAHGGMALVNLAVRTDDPQRRPVALKVIRPGLDTEELLRRFRQERRILARLHHPNIARLLDAGTTEAGVPYVAMDYVEGVPIDEYCSQRSLSIAGRVSLFRTVCSAVHYAHEKQIIHRDLKPRNILVTSNGTAKLLDFGIAKLLSTPQGATADLTRTGRRLMTPEYASPEQVMGRAVTAASDVYSLGVILYELLTGVPPYEIGSRLLRDMARTICEQMPAPPSEVVRQALQGQTTTPPAFHRRRLAGDLDAITMKALAKAPETRYDTVAQLSDDLKRYLDGWPVLARKQTMAYVAAKAARRAGSAALAGAGGVLAPFRRVARPDREAPLKRAVKLSNLGDMLEKAGEVENALEQYRQALQLAEELVATDPDNAPALRSASIACNRIGTILEKNGDPKSALEFLLKAVCANEVLAAARPDDGRALRNLTGNAKNIGIAYECLASDASASPPDRLRHWQDARAWYRQAIEATAAFRDETRDAPDHERLGAELAAKLRHCETAMARIRSLHPDVDTDPPPDPPLSERL